MKKLSTGKRILSVIAMASFLFILAWFSWVKQESDEKIAKPEIEIIELEDGSQLVTNNAKQYELIMPSGSIGDIFDKGVNEGSFRIVDEDREEPEIPTQISSGCVIDIFGGQESGDIGLIAWIEQRGPDIVVSSEEIEGETGLKFQKVVAGELGGYTAYYHIDQNNKIHEIVVYSNDKTRDDCQEKIDDILNSYQPKE